MTLPTPVPGLVIGYEFLFRTDKAKGKENAAKPHPCAIIIVSKDVLGRQRVTVLAISHTPPSKSEEAYYLPLSAKECNAAGLDGLPQWVNIQDANSFDWPGFDLARSAPDGSYTYGRLHKDTFQRIVDAVKKVPKLEKLGRD